MPKKITIENLARMVKEGFDEITSKMAKQTDMDEQFSNVSEQFNGISRQFSSVSEQFERVDDRLDHLDARMGRMETDLSQIKGEIVHKFEFEDLEDRVKYIETKIGIESGK